MVKDEAWRTGLRGVLHRNLTEFTVSLHTVASGLMSVKNNIVCANRDEIQAVFVTCHTWPLVWWWIQSVNLMTCV